MQQRMKHQAEKHRTERSFAVGDEVFLRLQPYIQQSVARRINQKLSFKFFGPFRVLERIGQVAYKLELPPASRIHHVFHVSQLKACIGNTSQVSKKLPSPDTLFQVPMSILRTRVRQQGHETVAQGLVHWSGSTTSASTWEDLESLRQQFPYAAWGQAGSQGEGIVNGPSPAQVPEGRPKRSTRKPAWLTTGDWLT